MSHRKWRETKQQLIRWPDLALLGCCLVSPHFQCDILATITVLTGMVEKVGIRLGDSASCPGFLWPRGQFTQPRANLFDHLLIYLHL